VPLDRSWLPLQNIPITTAGKQTYKPKNALKESRLGCRLKLSNSKSGCEVAALHLLLNQRPPITSSRSPDESTFAFHLCIPVLTSVSPLETERLFRIVTQRADS
jgi:hypothetical protein